MSREVEFFFDYVSPYTYLASTQLGGLSERAGVTFRWRPFVLGGVFQATGNSAPMNVKAKGAHLFTDLERWAKCYGVPLNVPTAFPMKTITSMRMALAADEQGAIVPFSERVFKAYWADNMDISNNDVMLGLAAEAGLDGQKLLARANEQEIKDRLRENTDEAVRRGAFGAPTLFVDNEMFFGNDRLMLLEKFLKNEL